MIISLHSRGGGGAGEESSVRQISLNGSTEFHQLTNSPVPQSIPTAPAAAGKHQHHSHFCTRCHSFYTSCQSSVLHCHVFCPSFTNSCTAAPLLCAAIQFSGNGEFFFRISSISQYRTQNNHLAVTAMQVQTEIGCFIQLDTVSVHLTTHTHTHTHTYLPFFFCGRRSRHVESVCC